ncbi:uncharacterized protein BDR25DRAFT_250405 [Lindgomyces ingoldianus]|uniref:Uncharacterized protein n=1 Tax=Lindgomyces ingoldianus TaxID=673940 RepID=A0ACB6RHI3_9PLEO|nr:uncharacterized protein BDR25DRAFT_250405 [Lindgomyces ingoldianus]KAF2477972.1 hypothetical protein BDR25DRAFT_250405 [Lindgomyces ingoldianus]
MSLKVLSLAFLATAYTSPLDVVARADSACQPCNPSGATGTNPPTLGSDMKSMYVDLLNSVKGIHFAKRESESPGRKRATSLCCQPTTDCLNVQGLNIPMCYDKFTTNVFFADGSSGSLTTGDYSQGNSFSLNWLTGAYTKGSESGNIYSDDPAAKPNTAILSIPPQFTGTGVGSAIPRTELGSLVTTVITTTIPGSIITAPTTLSGTTIFDTVSGRTTAVTTIPPKTITTPTTIAPVTSTMTSVMAAASSSKGAAGQIIVDSNMSFGMSIFTALMYAIYAL